MRVELVKFIWPGHLLLNYEIHTVLLKIAGRLKVFIMTSGWVLHFTAHTMIKEVITIGIGTGIREMVTQEILEHIN